MDFLKPDAIRKLALDAARKKVAAVRQGIVKPDNYRRGLLSGALNRLNPKNHEMINQTILDLDDLAQNGDKLLTRRQFLSKIKERAIRRNKPFIDDARHTPLEKIGDTFDTLRDVTKPPNFSYFVDFIDF